MDKNELYSKIKEVLVNDFDIDEALITPEASIEEDLELDSIDSVENKAIFKLKNRAGSL